jgi:hypothetical protein
MTKGRHLKQAGAGLDYEGHPPMAHRQARLGPIEVKSASSHLTFGQSRSVSMSSAPQTNVISDDGLRYSRGKPPGGAILSSARPGFMSCFKCGGFRPPTELASKRILGANHKVCKAGCKR